jgi:hypothetical protein
MKRDRHPIVGGENRPTAGPSRLGSAREPLVGEFGGSDLVLEMITNDRLDPADLDSLMSGLATHLAGDALVTPAVSALEAAGTMWWLCLYLWCRTPRSRARSAALLSLSLDWARTWRKRNPQHRPVYVATLDTDGQLIEARLLRREIETMPRLRSRARRMEPRPLR